jgi:hypothetical protein
MYAGGGGKRGELFTVVDFPGYEVRKMDRVGTEVKEEEQGVMVAHRFLPGPA